MMVEAARTTASPAATWAIVIVAVAALAFWLTMIYLADRSQVRASGRARAATWPSYPGAWASDAPVPQGETPTRADIPAQPAAGGARPDRPAMPAQRTGDADRAERSYAGPGTPDEEGQGR
jgi:hypothetical protein